MEVKSLTRRKFFRRMLIGGSAVAVVAATDAVFIEPKNLVAERVNIKLDRLPEAFSGFRIAQISDIHCGPYMGKAGVERAVELARTFKPDLLVITGDFVSHPFGKSNGPEGARQVEPCAEVLSAIKDFPTVAILGNHDHWNSAKIVTGALRDCGIKVLRNEAFPIERGNSRLWISGIDDVIAGAADLNKTLRDIPPPEANVLLAHEPDFADHAARFPVDLQLSGHSHGGQVRMPGVGAIILPEYGEKYSMGLYQIGRLQLYTNRGIGVINPPVRFHCPPEVTFVTLLHPSAV